MQLWVTKAYLTFLPMSLFDRILTRGHITHAEPAARRMRRLRVAAPGLEWTPGQQIHVHIGKLTGPRRTYSIWDLDADGFELRVLDHDGDGPGAQWARTVKEDDEVLFRGPEGGFVPRTAAYHVFAGDETAAPAFAPMIRALPEGSVYAVVEVDTPDDRLPLPGAVTWRYREGASPVASGGLVDAVRVLDLPDEPGAAYVAGEARTVQAVRAHLVRERRWPRRSVTVKPFWAPGKTGMD